MEPDTILHFSRSKNYTEHEFKNVSAIKFTEIKILKGEFKKIILKVYFEYINNDKTECPVTLVVATIYPPTETNPTLPLITTNGYITDSIIRADPKPLLRILVRCENKEGDDFDFKIRYITK